jgi:gluconate 2-dehydrogenase gamma chain
MANQGHDRREALEMLALAAFASHFSGFSKWVCAAQHAPDHAASLVAQPRPATYRPEFFTPHEYALIDQLTGIIIPKDESPGAREAGVSEFIDFMAAHDPKIQQPFRNGLRWLNEQSRKRNKTEFSSLQSDQQNALLRTIAYREHYLPGQETGQEFFALIRRYTVMGYYTSRIGLEELDFPGLRLYTESPACPHENDREHRHLPPPRY